MKRNPNYPILLASQFLSAFGDNVILAVILGQLTFMQRDGQLTSNELRIYNVLYTCLLFVPYILLAPIAGYLNDRFPKTGWLLGGNLIKLIGTAIAGMSVWWGHIWQAPGYFIVGIGSCIYGPAKYGILPEILPRERLVKANGTIELLTLIAILLGPVSGAKLVDLLPVLTCYTVLLGIFASSLALNFFMKRTPHNPEIRLRASVSEFFGHFRSLFHSPRLARVLLGTGVFWVCGAVLKMNFQPWGLNVLGFKTNAQIAELGLWLGVGVMAGSILAGQLHKVGDLRATQLYGGILAMMVLLLSALIHARATVPVLIIVGASAGLFLIPLNAALQAESDEHKLGKTIASQNLVDNIGMVLGGLYVLGGIKAGLGAQGIFVGLAVLVGAAVACLRFPSKPAANHFPTRP